MFKNEYFMDKSLIKEYVYRILGKKIIIVGIVIFVLASVIFGFDKENTRYVMLAIGIIGLLCSFLAPIIMIKTIENASKGLNNGKVEKTVLEFDKKIKLSEGIAKLEFDYNQIRKVRYTKSFIVLRIHKDASILVYKKGFTKGNERDFMKFIAKKCI